MSPPRETRGGSLGLCQLTGEPDAAEPAPAALLHVVRDAEADADARRLASIARSCLRARRARDSLFPPGLLADPAWDMLLELFVADAEGRWLSVSDACAAARVPQTTGLRWVAQLERLDLVRRRADLHDARRSYVHLTVAARRALAGWLADFGGAGLGA
ncbi:MAG: MarR family winged helix-turn-helix transcriptional regulator [Sphingomonas sp.]